MPSLQRLYVEQDSERWTFNFAIQASQETKLLKNIGWVSEGFRWNYLSNLAHGIK